MYITSYKRISKQLTALAWIAAICCMQSCKKFLDEPQRSGLSLVNTTDACMQVLDYSLNNSNYLKDGLASSDDYYLSDADFDALDEESRGIYSWDSVKAIHITGSDWLQNYKKIYNANVVFESLDKIAAGNKGIESDGTFKLAKGFSSFLRSYSYYNLMQLYAPPYASATADNNPGVPLRLTSDINYASSRNTVKECYDQIIKDLEAAIQLLPAQTIVSTRPNQSAAYGLLARVYQTMGVYDKALEAANNCLTQNNNANKLISFSTLDKVTATPFQRFSSEVLFHATIAASQLKWKIDSLLYRSFDDHDLRKVIYFKANTGVNQGTYYFTGNFEPSTTVLFSGIAVDEIYLIRAECYARTGKTNEAMTDLNTLLRSRWEENNFTNLTASGPEAALTLILTERRKELVLRDLRWTDLRRLNQETARAVSIKRLIHGREYILQPGDKRYSLLLPYDVIGTTAIPQNPR